MPSEDDEDARTISQEPIDDSPNMTDEIEQKKKEYIEKPSDEKQSTSYVVNSRKIILLGDEGLN